MMILKDTQYAARIQWAPDGTPTDVGAVTVTVTRADGTVVVTDAATTNLTGGVYEYVLAPSVTSTLDLLTLAWSRAAPVEILRTMVEVVGGLLFTEGQARDADAVANVAGTLDDAAKYPDVEILRQRDAITDLLENWTGVSWIPRYHRRTMRGTGHYRLTLPHFEVTALRALSIDGTAQTITEFEIDQSSGILYRTAGGVLTGPTYGQHNITVAYEHGFSAGRDGSDRIGLKLLLDRLVPSTLSDRMTSQAFEFGSIALVTEGGRFDNVTRLPEVNAWIRSHARRVLVA